MFEFARVESFITSNDSFGEDMLFMEELSAWFAVVDILR